MSLEAARAYRMKDRVRRASSWIFILLFCTSSSLALAEEILLASAVSLREPVEEIARDFELSHPEARVRIVFGASSTLARQIEFGAPTEILLSADETWIEHLAGLGLIEQADSFQIGRNRLVVVNRKGSGLAIGSVSDFRSEKVERVALPPASVPLGRYARLWLAQQDLLDSIDSKTIVTEHARATIAAVENGHADVALVYRTDALRSSGVEISFEIPVSDQPKIVYWAALLGAAHHNENARALLDYLKSPEAMVVLGKSGFNF